MQYIELPQGKKSAVVNPEAAVMKGDIKATNLEELQRFDRVFPFDPQKIKVFSRKFQGALAGRELSAQDRADLMFLRFLPAFYTPDRVPGWAARLHFRIPETGDYTLELDGRTCRAAKGLVGTASAEFTMSLEILAGILRHEILEDANQLKQAGINEEADVELSDDMLDKVVGGRGACAAEASLDNECAADVCGVAAGADTDCGAAVCDVAACAGAACGADACAGAACMADAGGIGICGIDVCGGAACGGDVCVGAGCVFEGCAAAASGDDVCGGAVCGGDTCGGAACGGAACGGAASLIGGCGADLCGADACLVDITPGDACGADACAVDIIPIIPGI